MEKNFDTLTWKLIDKYFKDNKNVLVKHHQDSYNDFINNGLKNIFIENNPIILQKEELDGVGGEKQYKYQTKLYLGGKNGDKIYYGKPIIYDDNDNTHYMFPNEARLRNMSYGMTIHYDVDVEFDIVDEEGKTNKTEHVLEKIFLGKIPIMLQSDACVLKDLPSQQKFSLGECKNDPGGYFIINGKEKVIVSQEKFGDNLLYIRDKVNDLYSTSAEIRTASEDASKPKRTLSVKIVAPSPSLKNGQIVVAVPNVRKPIPLFILMRALGIESDKEIIKTCLLDLEKNEDLIDFFVPSIHDAGMIYTQNDALKFIATFTKGKSIPTVMEILMNYFLPNVGELNFKTKAYFLGYMTKRLINVNLGIENSTDRDSYRFKRIELSGRLLYDLFLEYYKIQKAKITTKIDKEYYYHEGTYQGDFESLILSNYSAYFGERILETGVSKAFKGNWGSQSHTKRPGVVQDLNRLSFFAFIAHLRKLNLPMDSSAKVVAPRLLHPTQWGVICPVHTPDGGNIGFHKHMAMGCHITAGTSGKIMMPWLREHNMKFIEELTSEKMETMTKVFVNGTWVGGIDTPQELSDDFKLQRRNGLIPIYTSIQWNIKMNEVHFSTDAGRLTRPIYYTNKEKASYEKIDNLEIMDKYKWQQYVSGFGKKKVDNYTGNENRIFDASELYSFEGDKDEFLQKYKGIS